MYYRTQVIHNKILSRVSRKPVIGHRQLLESWSAAPHSSTVSSDRGELIWGAIGTKVRPCAGSCELSTVGIEASAGISFSSHSMKRESRASLLGMTQLRYEAGKRSPSWEGNLRPTLRHPSHLFVAYQFNARGDCGWSHRRRQDTTPSCCPDTVFFD